MEGLDLLLKIIRIFALNIKENHEEVLHPMLHIRPVGSLFGH